MSGLNLFLLTLGSLLLGAGLSWLYGWFEDRRRDRHFRNPDTGRFYKDE